MNKITLVDVYMNRKLNVKSNKSVVRMHANGLGLGQNRSVLILNWRKTQSRPGFAKHFHRSLGINQKQFAFPVSRFEFEWIDLATTSLLANQNVHVISIKVQP